MGPGRDGLQMGLGMEQLVLGRLGAQETPRMLSEVPGGAAEPLHEPQAAAWEGRVVPAQGSAPALGSAPMRKSSSYVTHHF